MNRVVTFALAAAVLAAPAVAAADPGADAPIYVLRFAGIVCVRAPCPVWEAVEVGTCTRVSADAIDTVGVMDPDYQAEWLQSRLMQNPVTVRGIVAPDPNSEAILFKF